jgi:dGTPase
MVKDLLTNTIKNIKKNRIVNINDVYSTKKPIVFFSDKFKKIDQDTKNFLKKKMYNNKKILKKNNKGKAIISKLFKYISKNPYKFINKDLVKHDKYRAVSDFISGMTDRYAINIYDSIR